MPGFAPLLEPLELAGAVVTADALHTHREHADWLVAVKQADYLLTVKATQPTLLDRCARLPWHRVPLLDRTPRPSTWPGGDPHAQGRQRARLRLPHAKQVLQVTRKTRDLRTRRWTTKVVYAITSLAHTQASPARLADYLRGHWGSRTVCTTSGT